MGYQQLILTVLSITLFTMIMAGVNRSLVTGTEMLQEAEVAKVAVGVAQRIINEGRSKAYDLSVITIPPDTSVPSRVKARFNAWGNQLCHNPNEGYPNIDDLDDFNGAPCGSTTGMSFTVNIQGMVFDCFTTVKYVNDSNPEQGVSARTLNRLLTVQVAHELLPQPLTLKHVISFYGIP